MRKSLAMRSVASPGRGDNVKNLITADNKAAMELV